MVAHTFNPNTQEAEAGACLSSRPAGLHSQTLSQRVNVKQENLLQLRGAGRFLSAVHFPQEVRTHSVQQAMKA